MFEIEYRYKTLYGYAAVILRRDSSGWFVLATAPTGDEVFSELEADTFDAAILEVGEVMEKWETDSGGNPL